MNDITLHLNLSERIIFFALKISRFTQDIASQIYWTIIARPLIWSTWKLMGETRDDVRLITFRKKDYWKSKLGEVFKYIVALNAWLNGLSNGFQYYQFLLTWNPSIPLIALKNTDNIQGKKLRMTWLGDESPINADAYKLDQMMWFGTSEVAGRFRIISKYPSEDKPSKILIKCAWISGYACGETFIVDSFGGYGSEKLGKPPDSVYFPPKIVVWCFEAILSLGFITALVGVTYKIWTDLGASKYFVVIYEKFW